MEWEAIAKIGGAFSGGVVAAVVALGKLSSAKVRNRIDALELRSAEVHALQETVETQGRKIEELERHVGELTSKLAEKDEQLAVLKGLITGEILHPALKAYLDEKFDTLARVIGNAAK